MGLCIVIWHVSALDIAVCCYLYRQLLADLLQIAFNICLSHSICRFLYRQLLADTLHEGYSEIHLIHPQITLFPCQSTGQIDWHAWFVF